MGGKDRTHTPGLTVPHQHRGVVSRQRGASHHPVLLLHVLAHLVVGGVRGSGQRAAAAAGEGEVHAAVQQVFCGRGHTMSKGGCGQGCCSSVHGGEAGGILVHPSVAASRLLPLRNTVLERYIYNKPQAPNATMQKQTGERRLPRSRHQRHPCDQGNSRPRPRWGTAAWFSACSLASLLRHEHRLKQRQKEENSPLWRRFLQISLDSISAGAEKQTLFRCCGSW